MPTNFGCHGKQAVRGLLEPIEFGEFILYSQKEAGLQESACWAILEPSTRSLDREV